MSRVQMFTGALLRAAIVGLELRGLTTAAATLTKVADAYDAGRSIDGYMDGIAKLLNSDAQLDEWDEITARIDAEEAKFLE